MFSEKGCTFCRRYGMPVLPVRPALMEKNDRLPPLPDCISVPVAAEGDTAYTARLLREGFLYIWAERGHYWKNYFATADGYFYPLPEDGSIMRDVASSSIKPCINMPQELATASLITLPIKPPGWINGAFWFAWSEEQWTDEVRRQHEDADWYNRYMQKFDMDAWLMTHSGQQVLPLSQLKTTVAEYSPSSHSSTLKNWSPAPFKKVSAWSADDLHSAAETLSAGNGAILVLPDPVAVAMDIAALTRYRMNKAIDSSPELKRGVALTTMLSSIELSMRTRFAQAAEEGDHSAEQRLRYGWDSPAGPHFPAPDVADRLHTLGEASRTDRVDEVWQTHYEKYIDRSQEQAFNHQLTAWMTEYNQSTIVPVTRMYLNWLQDPSMQNYFIQHFDPTCPRSGGRYIQTVVHCLAGMQDKAGVMQFIDQRLNKPQPEKENYLLRAAFFNNDAWIARADAEIQAGGKDWWLNLSWDRLADAAKEIVEKYGVGIVIGLEKLSAFCQNAVMTSIERMVQGTPVRFAISILAIQGKAFVRIPVQTGVKHYINSMTRGMAGLLEMNGKTGGRLYSAMRKEAQLILRNVPQGATVNTHLPAIIDVGQARALSALPEAERLKKLGSVLRSEDEIVQMLFPRTLASTLARGEGFTPAELAAGSPRGLPLAGSAFSAYFQWMVLRLAWKESGWPDDAEGKIRFASNASMAIAASAEVLKRVMTMVVKLELPTVASLAANAVLRVARLGGWDGLGYIGGIIYTGVEFYEGLIDIKNHKNDIGMAHLINALGVGWVTVGTGRVITVRLLITFGMSELFVESSALVAFFLGPLGILIGALLVLGAGAWLLGHTRNDIQNWILSTQWRRIPDGEENIPEMYPDSRLEQKAYQALTEQND